MSELLVSFCYTRPLGYAIARIGAGGDTFEWVDLSSVPVPVYGATGLVRAGDRYYGVLQVRFGETFGTQLVEFDGHARVLRSAPLPGILDAHSLVACNDRLLVVSTGTNQVFELAWPDGAAAPVSRVFYEQDPGADTLHMNSLQTFDGRVYLSMFGARQGDAWHQANDGQVLDLDAGGAVVARGLRHPHALFIAGDTLMCVESRGGSLVHVAGPQRAAPAHLPGYLRGACTSGGTLYIGASMTRRRSKSLGSAYARAPLPQTADVRREGAAISSAAIAGDGCGLHVIADPTGDPDALAAAGPATRGATTSRWIDLSPFGPELYDVIAWHGAPVTGSRTFAMEQRLRAVNGEFTDLAGVWSRLLQQRAQMRDLVRELDAARRDEPSARRLAALAREIEYFS